MRTVNLGDVLEVQNGFAFDSDLFSETEGMPLIRIRDLKGGITTEVKYLGEYSKSFVVKQGDYLIGMDGEFRCYEWKGEDALLNQRVCRLRNFDKGIHPKFIFYGINLHLDRIERNTAFVTVKHISSRQIKEIKFTFPPLSDQIRIADILSKAEALIRQRKESLRLLDEFLKSTFLEMFGDPVRNEKGWRKENIRQVCEKFSDGPFGSNLKTAHYSASGVRVVRLNNIGVGEFLDEDKAYIPYAHYKTLQKYSCLPGDVIIGTMGEPNLRACLLPEEITVAINKADCILCRPTTENVLPIYLCYLLNSIPFVQSVLKLVLGQTRGRISMGRLSTVDIPVPPIELQKHFTSLTNKCEILKTRYRNSLQDLENLYVSLSQMAFKGELNFKKTLAVAAEHDVKYQKR